MVVNEQHDVTVFQSAQHASKLSPTLVGASQTQVELFPYICCILIEAKQSAVDAR